jgi:prefoldin subunit 5
VTVKQACITCLCKQICLPDLQLYLRQGESSWTSQAQACNSVELQRYAKQGALRVEYLERVLPPMSNDYPTWFAFAKRRGEKAKVPAKAPEKPVEPSASLHVSMPVVVNQDALLQELRTLRQVCQGQEQAIQALTAQQSALLEAVQRLGSVPVAMQGATSKEKERFVEEVEDYSIFIPANLVDSTQEVSVDVASGGNASQLEESAAQLRSLKTRDDK